MRPAIGPMLLQGQVQMQTVPRQVATNRRLVFLKIAMELRTADNSILAGECQLQFSGRLRAEIRILLPIQRNLARRVPVGVPLLDCCGASVAGTL